MKLLMAQMPAGFCCQATHDQQISPTRHTEQTRLGMSQYLTDLTAPQAHRIAIQGDQLGAVARKPCCNLCGQRELRIVQHHGSRGGCISDRYGRRRASAGRSGNAGTGNTCSRHKTAA